MSRLGDLYNLLRASRSHAREIEREIRAVHKAQKHVNHALPLPRSGVDYAFYPHPDPHALRRSGATFAGRYARDPSNQGKAITRQEAKALSGAGLDVFLFDELSGHIEGFAAGASEAPRAERAARAAGMPRGRPIYFACDFDAAGEGQTHGVLDWIRGAVHAIGFQSVGLYAGLDVIEAAHAERACPYLCQTLAWSRGLWSPHAQLRQISGSVQIAGADCDRELAVAGDFGQWRI